MMNMRILWNILLLVLSLHACASLGNEAAKKETTVSILGSRPGEEPKQFFTPGGEKEIIIDESGKEVKISDIDPEPFRTPSNNPMEYFRVIMSTDGYYVRQIRGASHMRRKPDLQGDKVIVEDIAPFDKVNITDDGLIIVKLNSKTGKVENVNFHKRIPRFHNLSRIMQNDATRWIFEHKAEEPAVTKFLITYYIALQKKPPKKEEPKE